MARKGYLYRMRRKNRLKSRLYTKGFTHGRIKRNAPKGSATTVLIRNNMVPDKVVLKMKYSERIVITSIAGSVPTYVFRGNSLYDPNLTSTGAQPNGFDQWSNFYQKYRVLGSSMKIRLANVGTTAATQAYEVVLVPTTNSPSGYTMSDYMGLTYATHLLHNGGSGNPIPYKKKYITTSKIFGVSEEKVKTDDTFEAAISTNPTNVWYWILALSSVDQVSTLSGYIYVDITYYCEMFDRITLAQS